MNVLRMLRDIGIIFAVSVVSLLLITMLFGLQYNNALIWMVMRISALYALLALILFSERLHTKIRFLVAQIFYVIMLNVIYIWMMQREDINIPINAYIVGLLCTIIIFVIVRGIIFSVDKNVAKEINERLKKKRHNF